MDRNNLLAYLDFNKEFKIRTDDSNFQLGAVISHKFKPFDFYSIKITDSHKRYSVSEKELLIIVETLKEFRTVLFGKILRIHTDHNTLYMYIYNTERVLRWILILEDIGTYT